MTEDGTECAITNPRCPATEIPSFSCEECASTSSFVSDSRELLLCAPSTRIVLLTGRDSVLTQADAVAKLAERSGQHGAALGMPYFLNEEYAARKIPHLVCIFAPGNSSSGVESEHLVGATLLFEYKIGGFGTGFAATGDSFGVRTVFGAEKVRGEIAVAACKALLDRGARMVLVSLKREPELARLTLPPARGERYRWGVTTREVQDSMILGESLEETLGSLGKRTRTRLRASRRRFDAAVPCEFVADAIGRLALDDEFLARLNRESLEPIEQATFNLQLRSTERLAGGFLCGLHSAEYGWLALLGGWRQGDTTWVEWQVNRKGFEKLSLGSVLRSYLLEDEVARRTRRLGFHGSTSHTMAHRFVKERVVDVLGRRRSLMASLLVRLVPFAFRMVKSMAHRGNFLGNALSTHGMHWTRRVR